MKARALKRKELKLLREKGISLTNIAPEKGDEVVDAVLDLVYQGEEEQKQLDEMEYSDCLKLFVDIVQKTFGSEVQEKK